MADQLKPDSPCEARIISQSEGGLHVELFVPTYSGGQTFTLTSERSGDGDWRIYLPCWPKEEELHDPAVTATLIGHSFNETVDVCNGIAYVGAPDVEVERKP